MPPQITAQSLDALQAAVPLHARFPNVAEIRLLYVEVDDATFAAFLVNDARHMRRLDELDVSFANGPTDASLAALAHCTGLCKLRLPLELTVSPALLYALQCLPDLRVLDARMACDPASLAALGGLTRLEKLTLFGAGSVAGVAVFPRGLAGLHTLEMYRVEGVEFDFGALSALTDLGMNDHDALGAASLRSLAGLRRMCVDALAAPTEPVCVASLTRLTVGAGVSAASLACFPSLQRLDCGRVSDGEFRDICHVATQLRKLSIDGGEAIRAASLLHVSRLAGLTKLSLIACDALTDAGLVHVLTACERLHSLDLAACKSLTHRALLHMILHAPSLRHVFLQSIRDVGEGDTALYTALADALGKEIVFEIDV